MRSCLACLALAVLHAVYWLLTFCKSFYAHLRDEPAPLLSGRKQLPTHLALVLVGDPTFDLVRTESAFVTSAERAASWCHAVGIQRLTVYDRAGILMKSPCELRARLAAVFDPCPTDSPEKSKMKLPLTPPPSDDGDSRSSSPDAGAVRPKLDVHTMHFSASGKMIPPKARRDGLKRRRSTRKSLSVKPLTLHVVSRQSAKPAIARVAQAIIESSKAEPSIPITQDDRAMAQRDLDLLLEGHYGFPSPDLMIVHDVRASRLHKKPLELHGFPPWQTRLTEFYFDGQPRTAFSLLPGASATYSPLEEIEFRRALDEFAAAEMRLGK